MVVGQGRRLRTLRRAHVVLLLIGSLTRSHGGIADTLTRLVGGVVKQSTNVMHKKRVQKLGDLLLVGEV